MSNKRVYTAISDESEDEFEPGCARIRDQFPIKRVKIEGKDQSRIKDESNDQIQRVKHERNDQSVSSADMPRIPSCDCAERERRLRDKERDMMKAIKREREQNRIEYTNQMAALCAKQASLDQLQATTKPKIKLNTPKNSVASSNAADQSIPRIGFSPQLSSPSSSSKVNAQSDTIGRSSNNDN